MELFSNSADQCASCRLVPPQTKQLRGLKVVIVFRYFFLLRQFRKRFQYLGRSFDGG